MGGELPAAVEEDPFDPVGEVQLRGERRGALELGLAELGGELEQGQRVAPRLGHQPVDDLRGRCGAQALVQQRAGGLGVETGEHQLVQAVGPERSLGAVPSGEDHEDAVGVDPTCTEEQGVSRGGVEPVRIVDEAQHQSLLGR